MPANWSACRTIRPAKASTTWPNGLTLSLAQLEKYFLAADKILERLLGNAGRHAAKEGFNRGEARRAAEAILFSRPGEHQTGRDAAQHVIARFARRAFRRPVSEAEIARLMRLYDQVERRGDRHENGVRLMLKAVLVSPHFLLRVERDRPGAREAYPVGDHELAVRLSYFLWSTMPDPELFALADQKKLSEPAILEQQIKRMLADRKARALTDYFAVQWLQLRKLNEARPSQEFFPSFTNGLRHAMYAEAVTFFDQLRDWKTRASSTCSTPITPTSMKNWPSITSCPACKARRCARCNCGRRTIAAACSAWAAS